MDTQAQAANADSGAAESSASDAAFDVESQLAAAQKLADERYQELQYARAEIDNVRKRAEKSAVDRLAYGRRQLLAKFLPVLDNLQRALTFDDSGGLREGLQATLRGFEGILASEQVVALDTVAKPFDPHVAEAIATRETTDFADDIVLEEAQRGYRMGEDLLRPALVVVAKRSDPSVEAEPAPAQE